MSFSNSMDSLNTDPIGSLIFVCPDQFGIIANLSDFFAQRDISISKYSDFSDDGTLFSRLEWTLNLRWESEREFEQEFAVIAKEYEAYFDVRFSNYAQSVGLIVGSESHAFIEFANRYSGNLVPNVNISFVISSDESVGTIANRYGYPFFYTEVDQSSSKSLIQYEKKQLDIINRYKPNCLGFAGYDTILSPEFIDAIDCPMVKVKRTFMPNIDEPNAFKKAYEQGVKMVGATAYFVSNKRQYGPIIEQGMSPLNTDLTLPRLIKKSCQIEQQVFVEAMAKIFKHKVVVYRQRTVCFN